MSHLDPSATTLHLLGPVGARRGGESLRVGGPRQRTLLALLAIRHGRWLSTDVLVEEVFEGEPTDAAETTLRAYVSKLRAALGADVRISGGTAGYLLEIAPDAIDAVLFERLVAEADEALRGRRAGVAADRLRTALALWRGRPFEGRGAEGILRIEAERLEELRLHAVESRVEADLAVGAAGELVDELERLVREHPFREAFWRQLMLALYRSERQADALAAFHRARAALDDQLGIEPGAELVALEAAILRHEVAEVAPPAARHNLPAAVTSFIGRSAELSQLEMLVGANRLVTLTGVGGVGKTRLAIEAARGLAPSFADGVAFVDLAPLTDASLVADQVTAVLEVPGNASLEPLDRLVAHLRDREVLLLLDNCEHLLDASATVAARLLAMCPGLRMIATSRELLGVDGEAEVPVLPLSVPTEGEPSIRDSEAVRLFLARARAARPSLPDDEATLAAVARICAVLEGIPLAIELAAARARVLSPAEIGERLRDRFRFLVSWRRLGTARHRTLREAMDWSHDLLDVAGQRLLAELSVFSGGFTLGAVEGVCTVDVPGTELDQVQRLVEASLVTVDQEGGRTRYGLLETVREYAAEQLEASGRSDELHRRHAEHFAALAEQGWQPIRESASQAAWHDRFRADRDNFRAALAWSLERGEPEFALRIADTLWWHWWIRGEAMEGRTWLERGLAAGADAEPSLRARCSLGLAGLCWSLGDLDAAELPAREAHRLGTEIQDDLIAGGAANTLALIRAGQGDLGASRELLRESAARHRTANQPQEVRDRNVAIAIDNLGWTSYELGDLADAFQQFEEARQLNERLRNPEGVAMNDLHLSLLECEAGRFAEGRKRLWRALAEYERVGFPHYIAECLDAAAVVANGVAGPADAAFALGASAAIRAELGNQPVPKLARIREREALAARGALGDAAYEAAYAEGYRVPAADAVRRILDLLAA